MSDKIFADFLKAQKEMLQAPPKKRVATSKNIIAVPGQNKATDNEMSIAYIIEKKPKAKKVIKYLQGMVDGIMAEAD
jgi:hypothetical protein